MTERRIENSNHLRGIQPPLIAIILTLAPCFYFYWIEGDSNMLLIGLGFVLLFAIPTSIIHWNYYTCDKGKKVLINPSSKYIQIDQAGLRRKIDFANIKRLVLTRGAKHSRSIFHKYYYFQIELNDNDVIYLTSLLLQENDLSYWRVKSRTTAFPTIEFFKEERMETGPDGEEIEKFKFKYQSKDSFELEKIISDKRFVKEAKIAATQLLTERRKDAQQLIE